MRPSIEMEAFGAISTVRESMETGEFTCRQRGAIELHYHYFLARVGQDQNLEQPGSFSESGIRDAWNVVVEMLHRDPDLLALFSAEQRQEFIVLDPSLARCLPTECSIPYAKGI